MPELSWPHWGTIAILADWVIRLLMLPIVPTRRSPEAAKGWLLLSFFLPWVGLVAYVLIGRPRLPRWRLERLREYLARVEPLRAGYLTIQSVAPPPVPAEYEPSIRLSTSLAQLPNFGGNAVELLTDYAEILDRIVADIESSRETAHLAYYIFKDDPSTAPVIAALSRAVARGVHCRVLVDAFGSRPMIPQLLPRLRGLGIEARVALPFRWRKPERLDLRNHRKSCDRRSRQYTGSQNMVSPDFKPGLTYSELVARIEGPTALQLQLVFGADWFVETGHYIGAAAFPSPQAAGDCRRRSCRTGRPRQLSVPSAWWCSWCTRRGSGSSSPRPISSPAKRCRKLLKRLRSAASRRLIVDYRKDQFMVSNAQRSYYESLLAAGVRIHAIARRSCTPRRCRSTVRSPG